MANGKPYFALKNNRASDMSAAEVEKVLQRTLNAIQAPEESELSGENKLQSSKISIKRTSAERQIETMKRNPELYARLYSLKEDISNEIIPEDPNNPDSPDKPVAETSPIRADENGSLSMKISLLRPAGVSMEVVDGRVQFSPEDMTPEKMRAMVDFLQRHGLVVDTSNLKLENAGQETQQLFDNVIEQKEQAETGKPNIMFAVSADGNEADDGSDHEEDRNEILEDQLSHDGEAPQAAADENDSDEAPAQETSDKKKKDKKKKKEKTPQEKQLDALNESIAGWMNKNRNKGYSWFEGTSWQDCKNGSWQTFTCYSSESTDPFRKPITIDPKTKEVKCNYEFKIYTRINKDGKLEIAYSLPPGKNLTDDQAYLITSALKDAGVKKVKFDKMSDTDDAIMRAACAKRLLIPVGHKINAERYDKMIKTAAQKVDENSPDLYRYKYDLSMQMKTLLEAKGIDVNAEKNRNNPDCRRIRWAVGAYQLHPFRDLWEDFGLRGDFEKAVAKGTPSMADTPEGEKNGAAQVIGATMAVVSLYKIYEANMESPLTVKDLLDGKGKLLRNEEERKALRAAFAANNDKLDTNVRDLSPGSMRAIYKAMCKTETAKAKQDIDTRYLEILRNNQDIEGKGESPEKAVSDCLNNARARIEDVNGQLEDCELKKIYLTRFSLPHHDFSDARAKARQEGLIRSRDNSSQNSSPQRTPAKSQNTY